MITITPMDRNFGHCCLLAIVPLYQPCCTTVFLTGGLWDGRTSLQILKQGIE